MRWTPLLTVEQGPGVEKRRSQFCPVDSGPQGPIRMLCLRTERSSGIRALGNLDLQCLALGEEGWGSFRAGVSGQAGAWHRSQSRVERRSKWEFSLKLPPQGHKEAYGRGGYLLWAGLSGPLFLGPGCLRSEHLLSLPLNETLVMVGGRLTNRSCVCM